MKKIGIITHYYESQNYGGLLQAYALCKKLEQLGYSAEQIQYKHVDAVPKVIETQKRWTRERVITGIGYRISKITKRKFHKNMSLRRKALATFRESIPHSNEIYTAQTVKECNEVYDVFITGSDQVWNVAWYDEAYFLKFVINKPKYSYAASVGTEDFDNKTQKLFKENLAGYSGISVRESTSVELLQPLTNNIVHWVLDPTLLFMSSEWDEVCSERKIQEEYLFCYFLGEDLTQRELAKEYAKKCGLKIVTLPHLGGRIRKCDNKFGDIQLWDVTPLDFISLVKYSKCIFTDSFHACVFANIYNREFFVFDRTGSTKMSGRIVSLLKLFGNIERFCESKEKKSIDYIESLAFEQERPTDLAKKYNESMEFLQGI